MRSIIKALAVAAGAVGLLAAGAAVAEPVKIGFVYVGPKNDGGWSQRHDKGRLDVEKAFPGKVTTTFVENVPEGPDAERVIEQLARSGHKLIFTTSFGFMNPTLKVAAKFPDVKFEHATGYKRADNVATYNARFYEGRYVIGQIAAKMSKKGTAGYIASFPIPEVVMGINSFLLGAQSINPDFKMKVVWVNTWHDPAKESDAAKSLIDQGVDILTQHTDSPAPLQIAQERGVYAFGQAENMYEFAQKATLTSIVDNWGPYYVKRVGELLNGTWKSTDTWDGIKQGTVEMAPYTNLPDDVVAMAKATAEKISSGAFHPFTGPVFKQDGTEFLKAGQVIDDGTLAGMNFYVKGVDDKLPK
jgi:simple sugar transport system substrate-binding protein